MLVRMRTKTEDERDPCQQGDVWPGEAELGGVEASE